MHITEEYRMYIVVREDLQMPAGKAMGQTAHAAEGTLVASIKKDPLTAECYMNSFGRKKIVLGIKSLDKLMKLQECCNSLDVPNHLVTDSARTVFTEPTVTCLGIGPVSPEQQDQLKTAFKRLQLYK